MSEKGPAVCPRLVDYLTIVGNNTVPHKQHAVQQPQMLARYPPTDHKDFPLPRDMVYFCQPDGTTFTYKRRPTAREKTSFIFTLTDKDSGITRFGICLNFYRGIEKKSVTVNHTESTRQSWKQGTDRSTDSAFSSDYKSHSTVGPSDSDRDDKSCLQSEKPGFNKIFHGSDLKSDQKLGTPRTKRREHSARKSDKTDSDLDSPERVYRQRAESGKGGGTSSRNQSLTSICLISSHPFFSSFRECLSTLKKLVDACSNSNARWRVGGRGARGADSVWAVLTGEGIEAASSFLLHDVREIETWILRLLSAPIPVSGRTRLELEIVDRRYGPLLIFALPDPTRFGLCDFPLHLPLELLGVDLALQVMTIILLERKVLLHSRDMNALSLCVLSLTHLLYPLQYMFPVIPILPTSMQGSEQLLFAPTPYVIGLPASFLKQHKLSVVPDDVWMVDLDSATVTPPSNPSTEQCIPPLPEIEGKILKSQLKQALASLSVQPIANFDQMPPEKLAALLRAGKDLDDSLGCSPLIYGNDVDSVDIATRVAMVRFFNSSNVLANFSEHTRTLRLYPRPVVAFQINSFLRSRPRSSTYLTKLTQTQAVEFYAEWALMPTNLAYQRIHTGLADPTIIGDKFKWYAHNLDPVSFVVWDNLSSLNTALKCLKESEVLATDESGSDSDGGSSSSSFSSISEISAKELMKDEDPICRVASQPLTMSSGLDPASVYNPPKTLQYSAASSDSALSLPPPSSEESQSEPDTMSPVPEEVAVENMPYPDDTIKPYPLDKASEDVFTSESENSSATCKTVRNLAHRSETGGGTSPTPSASFGSELSLTGLSNAGSEGETGATRTSSGPMSRLSGAFSVKFPRSRLSDSSSSGGESRKVSESRQSSSEEVAQELFHNIEQFTKQAKKAAESFESAVEKSKSKVITKGYVRKDTLEDMDIVRKNVVDDFKTALERKNEFIKNLGDSNESEISRDTNITLPDGLNNVGLGPSRDNGSNLLLKTTRQISEPCDNYRKPPLNHLNNDNQRLTKTQSAKPRLMSSEAFGTPASSPIRTVDHSRQISHSRPKLSPCLEQHQVPGYQECPQQEDFFSNIDISEMAHQTTDFIGGLLETKSGPESVKSLIGSDSYSEGRGTLSTPGSISGSPVSTPRNEPTRNSHPGPFPKGRRGLVEKSPLIRHPSWRATDQSVSSQGYQQNLEHKNVITAENHNFLKDVVDQVIAGDGVGWLKLSRLKKLMEDENYRNMILAKLNKSMDKKVAPDDHIQDICLKKTVYKGMLKVVLTIVHGLEVSIVNFGVGGLSSAFQLLEISHTHFWTKDLMENVEHGLTPSSANTAPGSNDVSPYGSRENLDRNSAYRSSGSSLQTPNSRVSINPSDQAPSSWEDSGDSRKSSQSEKDLLDSSSSEILRNLIQQKKQLLFGRLASLDSEAESDVQSLAASETGSMTTNPAFQRNRGIFSSIRSAVSDTETEENYTSPSANPDLWPSKSSLTSGYRYRSGNIVSTVKTPSPDMGRTYVFEGILMKVQSNLWSNGQFWEDTFLDAVAQEREAIGMDSGACEMMERYRGLSDNEKKRLEHDEDRLLSTMLFNLMAFMVMMQMDKTEIKRKVRRLLGKSHIGLIYSQEINLLLEKVGQLTANDIDLKQLPSRQVNRQSFTVHCGTDASGDLLFLEVRDDGLVLRTVSGAIAERWFFERLVNMTYSPKNKVLCLWRRNGGQTQLHKYYTKKCKDLYYCIKGAMERAAARGAGGVAPGMELGGEFPVQDIQSGEGGLLQVCMEGVGLLFASSKFFVRLEHIRKCFTMKEGIFVLEEFNPKSRKIVQRKYKSSMAVKIAISLHRVISVLFAQKMYHSAHRAG